MSKILSHENCAHAATKSGRAQCRRNRAKFADVFADVFSTAAEPAELEARYDRLLSAADDLIETMSAEEFVPASVTRETWREYKTQQLRIAVQLDDEKQSEVAAAAYVTAWGAQWISYVVDGKTKRVATSCIRVTTIG